MLSAAVAPKGVRLVSAGMRKLSKGRAFFTLHNTSSPSHTQPKLFTHSGHGSVSILHSDIPLGRMVSASTARVTIRRIIGAPCLGKLRLFVAAHCPRCGLTANSSESLERHVVRCPNGGMRHMMHIACWPCWCFGFYLTRCGYSGHGGGYRGQGLESSGRL